MNIIYSTTIYTAGPIDLSKDTKGWRDALAVELANQGVAATLFDPSTAYKQSVWGETSEDGSHLHRMKYIYAVNRLALLASDVMVVSLPSGTQSVGTSAEIHMAYTAGVPIYMLTDIPPGKSAYLDVMVDSARRFTDIKDLVSVLFNDFNGFTSDRVENMMATISDEYQNEP